MLLSGLKPLAGILAAMQHPRRICALVAAAALALGGCGSSGPSLPKDIPAANAFGLNGYLVRAQQACKVGDRFALREAANLYSNAVTDLPSSVDPDVITVLRKGGDNLSELAQTGEGCASGATGATGIFGAVP
jgi:hypothetical protein